MKKKKYKVGDRVRIVDEWPKEGGQNRKGKMDKWLGKVMTVRGFSLFDTYKMAEDTHENDGDGWYWYDRFIAGLANDTDKIVVTSDGKTITAKQYDGKKVVKTAKAKCSTADTYDFKEGARLALERLLGKKKEEPVPVPKFKRGDVVRVTREAKYYHCLLPDSVAVVVNEAHICQGRPAYDVRGTNKTGGTCKQAIWAEHLEKIDY